MTLNVIITLLGVAILICAVLLVPASQPVNTGWRTFWAIVAACLAVAAIVGIWFAQPAATASGLIGSVGSLFRR
jgi:hypothetical protein